MKLRLSFAFFCFMLIQSIFGATLNVTNYGAWGDAVSLVVNCTSNSFTLTGTNHYAAGDVGKVVGILSAGDWGANSETHQDFWARVQSVNNVTNIVLNRPLGNTTNGATAIMGTYCSTGFSACITAAGPGDTINIPSGRYLVIPPVFDTNYLATYHSEPAAIFVSRGGFKMVGESRDNTVLVGNGLWQLMNNGNNVVRGVIFDFQGPFTNGFSSTMTFQDMTLDGGVQVGRYFTTGYGTYPASITNGLGWDQFHDAWVTDGSGPPWSTNTIWLNVSFVHWRGEMIKGLYNQLSGDVYRFTNCLFSDGQASANNAQAGNIVSGCTFSNIYQVMEIWQSCYPGTQYFENSIVVNCEQGLAIQGADTNRQPQGTYIVQSNNIQVTSIGVDPTFAQNVVMRDNIIDASTAINPGAGGGQGNASISNLVAYRNVFTNIIDAGLTIYSGSHIYFTNNTMYKEPSHPNVRFVNGAGSGETYFYSNTQVGGINPSVTTLYPLYDLSNDFPYNREDSFGDQTIYMVYGDGPFHKSGFTTSGTVYRPDNTQPEKVPIGAEMIFSNTAVGSVSVPVINGSGWSNYLAFGDSLHFYWSTPYWVTNVPPTVFYVTNLTATTIIIR